jgi:hypothetical protein
MVAELKAEGRFNEELQAPSPDWVRKQAERSGGDE